MSSKIIRYILFWFLFAGNIFVTSASYGQFFSLGNDPARVSWRYYKSDDFRIIYPEKIDSVAKRYIWLLHKLKPHVIETLNADAGSIDVILHPYTVMSNGMVGVAPRRMELFTTPSFTDDYVDSWEKHLVIHELRHVGQISKFERGIFKPLRWIAGEQAVAAGVGLYMSQWALEGDAVLSETEFTSAGRGRDPDHLIYYRAAFLNGDYRSWDRWTLGSYRDYVPDIYSFGYLFSSFVRYRSGNPYYLGEVTDYVISRFYDVNAQNKGYRNFTGLDKKENFEELKRYYTLRWKREDSLRAPFTRSDLVTEGVDNSDNGFYRYSHPMWVGDSVYAVKRDFDNISRLVSISDGEDELLHRFMGNISSVPIRHGDKIFWTEYITSPRWELEVFSDLFCYDIITGNSERLTYGKRLFHPSFAHKMRGLDENISFNEIAPLVAVSYSVEGNTAVAGYSLKGDKLFEYAAPVGYRVKEVVADGDCGYYALLVKEGGAKLFRIENQIFHRDSSVLFSEFDGSARWRLLADMEGKSMSDIKLFERGKIKLADDKLVTFISDYDGVKNLYGYYIDSGQVVKMTNVRFGISGYDINEEGKLVVSDFSQRGYSLRMIDAEDLSLEITPVLLNEEGDVKRYRDEVLEILSAGSRLNTDTLEVPEDIDYESKKYRKFSNILNVHSWAPIYYNIDNIKRLSYDNIYDIVSPGFILYSQNNLSTAYMTAGYSWHEGFNSAHLKFSYHGLYPVFELSADFNDRNRKKLSIERDFFGIPSQIIDTLEGSPYVNARLLTYIPLDYSRGGWNVGLIPSFIWRYTNDSYFSDRREKYSDYQYFSIGLNAYSVLKTAHRNIFPKYGVGGSVRFSASPFSGENFGSLLYASLYFYLPGLSKDHGLKVAASFQKQFMKGKNYFMANSIAFPPGYSNRLSSWAAGADIEYALPLYTGDISLGSALYIRRFQMIPFVSYYRNGKLAGAENLYSAGGSIIADINLLGISYPLSFGIKGGYTGEKDFFMELLFKTPL